VSSNAGANLHIFKILCKIACWSVVENKCFPAILISFTDFVGFIVLDPFLKNK